MTAADPLRGAATRPAIVMALLLTLLLAGGARARAAAQPTADDAAETLALPFDSLLVFRFSGFLEPGETVLDLDEPYLAPGSETVFVSGAPLVREEDYRLDFAAGRLTLTRNDDGARITVVARRRPVPLRNLYLLNPLRPWRDILRGGEERRRETREAETRAAKRSGRGEFVMGGSKSLMLRMGSGESVVLEQNLRLNLRGMLSDSVRVEAVLRDDDLPFQPEGNTERLDELDKVFIRISGPAGQAQVGDFVFKAPERRLTPFHRDFQGLQGDLYLDRGRLSAWLAQSRGLFGSLEFYGEDGLQGPYELLSALRSDGAVVLAGSERVRLNGRLLTRGRHRDYTIDYDLGTVTFNTAVAIGAGDLIRVDFRYSQENWRRTAWGASGGARFGPLRLDLLHFTESDDPEDPLAFSLTDSIRVAVAAAGDSVVIAPGVTEAPGAGRYVLTHENPDDPGMATYAWVDSLGDYNLRFHEAGAGLGDYDFVSVSSEGERIYAYRGEGLGVYRLGRKLSAPETYRIESLKLDLVTEALEINLEGALSDLDRNTLSGLDDGDNLGAALRADLRGRLGGWLDRELTLTGAVDARQDRFNFPGARYGSDHYRAWNLPLDAVGYARLTEKTYASGLAWGAPASDGIGLTMERMELEGRFTGDRLTADAGLPWRGAQLSATLRAALTEDTELGDGRRELSRLGLALPWPLLRGATVERELATSATPRASDANRLPELRGNFRSDRSEIRFGDRGGDWRVTWGETSVRSGGEARGHIRRFDASARRGLPRSGRLDLTGAYQKREGPGAGEQFQAETNLSWYARPGQWGGDLMYRLGSRRQRLTRTQLVYIGVGLGDRNEEGIYVGEGEGDYRRISLPTSDAVRTIDLAVELRVAHEEAREGSRWRRVGSETRLTLREETRDDALWRVAALDASRLRREDSTLYGDIELRQELRYRLEAAGVDLRYTFTGAEGLDERDTSGGRSEWETRHTLRGRSSDEADNVELTLERQLRGRHTESAFDGGNYTVAAWSGELAWTRHLERRFSGTLRGGLARRVDSDRTLTVDELTLEPAVTVTPRRDIRCDLSWRMTRSRYAEGDPSLGRPWFFDPPGWERVLRMEGTIQAGRNLTLSLRYELRDEVDKDRRHSLRMESRAYF